MKVHKAACFQSIRRKGTVCGQRAEDLVLVIGMVPLFFVPQDREEGALGTSVLLYVIQAFLSYHKYVDDRCGARHAVE